MAKQTVCKMFVFVGLITIVLFGRSVQGIQCYRCSSELGGVCESPSHSDGVVIETQTCTGSCMKYETSTGYYRECSYILHAEGCLPGSYENIEAEVCACNSDFCNQSNIVRPSAMLFITVLILAFLHKYVR